MCAPAAALVWLLAAAAPGAAADPGTPVGSTYQAPLVDHTEWTQWGGRSSLRVYPTAAGRIASRTPGATGAAAEAWAEVLRSAPDADTPGMQAQFDCHWQFAEIAQPSKTSWNLEPWRPVVDAAEMVASRCNPGSPEEPF